MKQFSLTIFFLILLYSSSIANSTTLRSSKLYNISTKEEKLSNNSQKRINNNKVVNAKRQEESISLSEDKEFEVYFQKVYSGNDPLKIIFLSETQYKKYLVSVFTELLVLKTIPEEIGKAGETYDTAKLSDMYVDGLDDATKHKCCVNVKFIAYQECSGDCSKTGIVGYEANNCLEVKVDDFTWRLCSENYLHISLLHIKLKTAIIKLKNKNLDYKLVLENLFEYTPKLKSWDWHKQLEWGKQCENTKLNLQSPINLDNPEDTDSDSGENKEKEAIPDLQVDFVFDKVEPVITKHGRENIIGIPDYAGLMRFTVGAKSIIYQPQFIALRFKSEHQIASKIFDGEIEIHLTEVNPDKKRWLTNGLVISIFLESVKETKSLAFLENLKMDFWRLELKEKNRSFFKPGKAFCLQALIDEVFKQEPKYYLYKGSLTTPPCTSNVLRLVLDKTIKIPEIQFKVLREQSLLDIREKEIHGRIKQESLKRKVVKGTCSNVKYNKSLSRYLENDLSQEELAGSKATSETATGDNVFTPSKRDSLRDAVIKFPGNKSIDELEQKLKEAQAGVAATESKSKSSESADDCGISK